MHVCATSFMLLDSSRLYQFPTAKGCLFPSLWRQALRRLPAQVSPPILRWCDLKTSKLRASRCYKSDRDNEDKFSSYQVLDEWHMSVEVLIIYILSHSLDGLFTWRACSIHSTTYWVNGPGPYTSTRNRVSGTEAHLLVKAQTIAKLRAPSVIYPAEMPRLIRLGKRPV